MSETITIPKAEYVAIVSSLRRMVQRKRAKVDHLGVKPSKTLLAAEAALETHRKRMRTEK